MHPDATRQRARGPRPRTAHRGAAQWGVV